MQTQYYHIIYIIIFQDRREKGIFPHSYIGSKTNCTVVDGVILDKKGKPYWGSSTSEEMKILLQSEEPKHAVVLYKSDTHENLIQMEYKIQVQNDVLASPLFFNKGLAGSNIFTDPLFATYRNIETGVFVRLLRTDPRIGLLFVGTTAFTPEEKQVLEQQKKQQSIITQAKKRKRVSDFFKGIPKSLEQRGKMSASHKHKGEVYVEDIDGNRKWVSSEEYSKSTGLRTPQSIAYSRGQTKKILCGHCGHEFLPWHFSRSHGDKCKHNPEFKKVERPWWTAIKKGRFALPLYLKLKSVAELIDNGYTNKEIAQQISHVAPSAKIPTIAAFVGKVRSKKQFFDWDDYEKFLLEKDTK